MFLGNGFSLIWFVVYTKEVNVNALDEVIQSEAAQTESTLRPTALVRYSGKLIVGDLTSGMGTFDAKVDSLMLKGSELEFEIRGADGVSGRFEVCGTAEWKSRAHKYACKVLLGYPGTDVPEIPTRLTFEVREVTAGSERLCYLSLVWGEAGSRRWIAHGLLDVAPDQTAL